ncbi:hypothetical protein C8A01DRAFT_49790 [Parachaetomium inaequale]|uniref:DUF7730 domain-containing protein n=1 Tax=Parachaetomium inaequale TaxID=2588326 RepID=A0AAN6PCV5_9PEZI|nr:hypothetical protein C8A01DRAFT_49790 [Parachaetomium inaequale]
MGFIRQVLRGKLPSRRRQRNNEPEQSPPPTAPIHALDTLPSLPIPRRPLTPTPPHPQQQPPSPFFRLPPELRQQIYRLVLSTREIHLDMRYTAAETTTPHSTRGAYLEPSRRWRWRASTCHRHPDAQPLSDRCGWGGPPLTACHLFPGTTCSVGREVLGLLLACRLAYREVVEVLYGENTFHVGTGAVVLYTDRLLPRERARAVRRLVYRVTEESVWGYAEEHLGIAPGLEAYGVLLGRVPRAFPGLVELVVVVQGALEMGRVHWGRGRRDLLEAGATRHCLLGAMDAVVRGFGGRLGECVLAMRHTAFDRIMEAERVSAEKFESRAGKWVQFWRPVTVACGDEMLEAGYWVRRASPEENAGPQLYYDLGALSSST